MNAEYTLPKFLSPEAKDFISNIFVADPEQRYGIEEIRNHPWYKRVKPETSSFGAQRTMNAVNMNIVKQLEQ